MKWPWERSAEKRTKEISETDLVKSRLEAAIKDLRKSLDTAEKQLRAGMQNGQGY